MTDKINVLFLCVGNSARSQMAEAFLNNLAPGNFEAFSAGIEPGVLNPLTVVVMEEVGISMSGHYAKGVDTYLAKKQFGFLITVCDQSEQKCPTVWPGVDQKLHWYFEDPAAFKGSEEEQINKFREIRDLIHAKVIEFIEVSKQTYFSDLTKSD